MVADALPRGPQRFTGGMRRGGATATRGLAELIVDERGVRVRLRRYLAAIIGYFTPEAVIPWESLRSVKRLRWLPFPVMNGGLAFIFANPSAGDEEVIFFCGRRTSERIIAALTAHGVVVEGTRGFWL